MAYIVCAEEIEGRWVAHVPDLPGCFAVHDEREAAIGGAPKAVEDYLDWSAGHGLHVSGISPPMMVSEVVRAWLYEEDYEVNAFFASDRPSLTSEEASEIAKLLRAIRNDLEAALEGLDREDLEVEIPGERWSIMGIVNHIATAEHWYLDRLGVGMNTSELPSDPIARVVKVRENTLAKLPQLADRKGVVTLSGETWSARKVMRRTLWHERDHTAHIHKLRPRVS
jgi:uncharacterized damage-inducible protein DinB/predicted RNase H-like HicB family nuclease